VFLHPLVCGLVLFAFAVMSVSDKLKHKALQAALAVTTLAVLIELPAAIHSIQVYAQGMRPSLEDLLQTETGVLSLIFAIRGAMFYKKASAAE
jgi:hypothetical protein